MKRLAGVPRHILLAKVLRTQKALHANAFRPAASNCLRGCINHSCALGSSRLSTPMAAMPMTNRYLINSFQRLSSLRYRLISLKTTIQRRMAQAAAMRTAATRSVNAARCACRTPSTSPAPRWAMAARPPVRALVVARPMRDAAAQQRGWCAAAAPPRWPKRARCFFVAQRGRADRAAPRR